MLSIIGSRFGRLNREMIFCSLQPLLQLTVDEIAVDELTSVVTPDVLRGSVDIHQPLALPTNIAGADSTIRVDEVVPPG